MVNYIVTLTYIYTDINDCFVISTTNIAVLLLRTGTYQCSKFLFLLTSKILMCMFSYSKDYSTSAQKCTIGKLVCGTCKNPGILYLNNMQLKPSLLDQKYESITCLGILRIDSYQLCILLVRSDYQRTFTSEQADCIIHKMYPQTAESGRPRESVTEEIFEPDFQANTRYIVITGVFARGKSGFLPKGLTG